MAVRHPLKAKSVFTCRKATCTAVFIIVFSILYNLPRWWEYEILEVYDPTIGRISYRPIPSSLRTNYFYITFYRKMATILLTLTPLVIMSILNAKIYMTVIWEKKSFSPYGLRMNVWVRCDFQVSRANRNRQALCPSQAYENSVAKMLLMITSVPIAAYMVSLAEAIHRRITGRRSVELPCIRDLLVIVAYSINFVIYCVKSTKFRTTLTGLRPGISTTSTVRCLHTVLSDHPGSPKIDYWLRS